MFFLKTENSFLPWCKTNSLCYAVLGTFFGVLFPFIAFSIDLYRFKLPVSFSNIRAIHDKNPLHYIIDTAPFFLGVLAYIAGKAKDKVEEKNDQILQALNFKDTFLANMSHEIRTPMAGIIGVVDMLSNHSDISQKEKEYLEVIQTSSKDLMKIINDILDFSKLNVGRFTFEYRPVEIKKTVNEVEKLFHAPSKAKNLSLTFQVSEEIPKYLMLDAVRLKQVLSNLVGNAIKFSSDGKIIVKASLKDSEASKASILFEVIDEGIGIDKAEQHKLFHEYRQLNNYRHAIGGTGLGLSICKYLVEYMGGELGVKSELGQGSNFWFTITVDIAETEFVGEQMVNENNTPTTDNFDFHVLMAEDNKTLCTVYLKMLKKLGCQTVVVHDGEQFMESYNEKCYDIILLDINMPKIDGITAMKNLRAKYKEVPPIIGISASALRGDAEKYIEEGLDDYLTKPFTIKELAKKLQQWGPTNASSKTYI